MDGIFEALACPVRRRLLLALAAASAGRSHVTDLCRHTGTDQKTVSRHLANLKLRGLILPQRQGQHVWYSLAEGRIRCERHDDGRIALTLTTPSGGVTVRMEVGSSG